MSTTPETEKLLLAISKYKEALDFAILSTPTGIVRNALTNKIIEIEAILNPELKQILKLNNHG